MKKPPQNEGIPPPELVVIVSSNMPDPQMGKKFVNTDVYTARKYTCKTYNGQAQTRYG
jgi:hypothetical protein